MEGECEEGAAANGLAGEENIVVKARKEDVAVATPVEVDGGDHVDLADGEALVGSATAVASPEEPARAPTKVQGSRNSGSQFTPWHTLVHANTLLLLTGCVGVRRRLDLRTRAGGRRGMC